MSDGEQTTTYIQHCVTNDVKMQIIAVLFRPKKNAVTRAERTSRNSFVFRVFTPAKKKN